MVGRLILRGLLCGLIAGLLTFGFARAFGEPLVERGIAFEEATAEAKGEAPEPEIVSRAVQAGLGLFTATTAAARPWAACSPSSSPCSTAASAASSARGPRRCWPSRPSSCWRSCR